MSQRVDFVVQLVWHVHRVTADEERDPVHNDPTSILIALALKFNDQLILQVEFAKVPALGHRLRV